MASNFALVAASAEPELAGFFLPSDPRHVTARGPGRFLSARNDSSIPTVNMFMDGESPSMKWAASIVDACIDQTTYALQCTSGPSSLSFSGVCGANIEVSSLPPPLVHISPFVSVHITPHPIQPVTVTAGPSTYRVSSAVATTALGSTVSATLQETCALAGTTQAICTVTLGGSLNKDTTSRSATTTYSGSRVWRYDVAITAGAEKLASPAACTSKPASNSNSGASVKGVTVWGLVGAVGVGLLLGW